MRYAITIFAVVVCCADVAQADKSLDEARPFLKTHCYSCHGPEKQKNDLRYDTLNTDLSDTVTLETWQNILDQLNLGEMPPEKKPQPSQAEVRPIIELLSTQLKLAYAAKRSTGGQTVMRRLNRFELRNTMRDLLHLHNPELRVDQTSGLVDNSGNGIVANTSSDPFREFPEDEKEHGFDNIGDKLVMSDFFLKLMLDAAEESLALADAGQLPKETKRHADGRLQKGGRWDHERAARTVFPDYDVKYIAGDLTPDMVRGGVGTNAHYRITVEVSGHNQRHPWGEMMPTDQERPLQVGLHLFNAKNSRDSITIQDYELSSDGETYEFSVDTWIDSKWRPALTWLNGPSDKQTSVLNIAKTYMPEHYTEPPVKPKEASKEEKKAYDIAYKKWRTNLSESVVKNYKGPFVRIHSMTVELLTDKWPPKSHVDLYGKGRIDEVDIEASMTHFAERAFRRPVTAEEIAPYIKLVRAELGLEPGVQTGPKKPANVVVSDLKYTVYKGKWGNMPDFSKVEPHATGTLPDGYISIKPANMTQDFGMVFEGTINAARAGNYHFETGSDDGSMVYIDGKKIVDNDGLHGTNIIKKGSIKLEPGPHQIRVEFFQQGGGVGLNAWWSGPGFGKRSLTGPTKPQQNKGKSKYDQLAATWKKALNTGYAAILCSPKFLYIKEGSGKLNDYELATRLSYFLWSSMPDEQLIQLAAAGKMTNAEVVEQQVERMLRDDRADAFNRHFAMTWLRLDTLGKMPPEKGGPFRFYHDRKFEPLMIKQVETFFGEQVRENGPIRNLIDSDYTYMNNEIATWLYNRKDISGSKLRKVSLEDPRRGGIFTMPAVMTATANGVDTSPITRGVWVLENVLGTPPSPPPPDVEPLSPDLRAAKTVKEQLELHRKQEACAGCHRKIDPLGFAMENFDPVGRWRDKYPKTRDNLDASATMANGKEIKDIVAFKQMLLGREEQVTRCLTEKLLTYSTGRVLEPADRGDVDKIVEQLNAQKGGLRDLVKLVATSEIFLTK